ncbi:MAG: hypothetical protein H6626_02695 [Pseudobdellovibrionaceae bacterium]|nr:hypothetical protein [Bdellovibrionales bacterium]USN48015.1 MAG: hypothetical protein H6626_02695 [Pseudobdellovibrionaceae bacterium]
MKWIVMFGVLFLNTFASAESMKSRGKAFNPDIGVNVLFLGQSSERDRSEDGMALQEAELQLSSDVDAYLRAKVLLAIEKEAGEFGIEPEEAFVESLQIPGVTLKVGKSKMPLGKHNQLHTHAYPFINAPLQNVAILGDEGFSEVGVGFSGLMPLPWYSEVSLEYVQGENADLFNPAERNQKVYVTHFKNLWEWSDSATFELGLSGAVGKNDSDEITDLYGADVTFKWRPIEGGKYTSFEWGAEYLGKNRRGVADNELSGVVSYLKYQMAERWWVQYRYDHLGIVDSTGAEPTYRHTALLGFVPTEFQAVRLQYESLDDNQAEKENRLSLQLNISIGAHPAHAY